MREKKKTPISYRSQIGSLLDDCFIELPNDYDFSSEVAFSFLNKCTSHIVKNFGQIVFILNTNFKVGNDDFSNWLNRFHTFLSANKEVLSKMDDHYGTGLYLSNNSKKLFCNYVDCVNKMVGELSTLCSLALSKTKRNPVERTVFIVHGHDTSLRDKLKSSLIKNNYHPIVLSDMNDSGITLFDKFEKYANMCTKAVILMTSDDLITKNEEEYYQGRPNVLVEYGYFLNMLERHDIVVLLEKGCKKPSDVDGVSYIEYTGNNKRIISKIIDSLDSYH